MLPEMFRAELQYLYTGEGMGRVVEWLNNDREEVGGGGLGVEGNRGGMFGLGTEGRDASDWGKIEGSENRTNERLRDVRVKK